MFVRSFHFIPFQLVCLLTTTVAKNFFFRIHTNKWDSHPPFGLLVMFMSFFHDILCVSMCVLYLFFFLCIRIFSSIHQSIHRLCLCVYVFIEKKGSFTSLSTPKIIIIIIIVVYTQHIHFFLF